jgi:hypothetical protein
MSFFGKPFDRLRKFSGQVSTVGRNPKPLTFNGCVLDFSTFGLEMT